MTEMPGSTTESLWKQCTVPSQTVSGNTLSIRHFPSETDQTLTQNLGATFHRCAEACSVSHMKEIPRVRASLRQPVARAKCGSSLGMLLRHVTHVCRSVTSRRWLSHCVLVTTSHSMLLVLHRLLQTTTETYIGHLVRDDNIMSAIGMHISTGEM